MKGAVYDKIFFMNVQEIQKTYTARLEPNKEQLILFSQFAGCARFVFNYALGLIKQALDNKQGAPSYTDLANLLPQLKKAETTAWLAAVHSQILQQALKDLESARKHFFRRLKNKEKAGFPKFKKKGIKDSFRYPQGVRLNNSRVYLPKIGWVKYKNSQAIEGRITQVTVKREGKHWYVHMVCQITKEIEQASITSTQGIGIDLGLHVFAYFSDGTIIDNPKYFKNDLKHLKRIQRRLARAKRGGSNRKKLAQKIAKLHIRIKNKRKDFLHKLSSMIVNNQDIIAVESLHVKGMVRNSKLARSISDVSWGIFIAMLKYKCLWYGKHLVQVDRFEPTSKKCSRCAHKQAMPLHVRRYQCANCGIDLDRDYNASINIRAAGRAVLALRETSNSSLKEEGIPGF
jgi:putative transposase